MIEPTIDVSVYTTGLIFFKPDPGGGENGVSLHALLPDARRPVAGVVGEPHAPVIQFDWEDLVNEDKRPFRRFLDLAGHPQGLWMLDKDQVEICGTAGASNGVAVDETPLTGRVPSQGDLESRRWIASPRRTEDQIRLKEGLVPLDPENPNADLLVAAMTLRHGTVRPASFASQQEQFVLVRVEDGGAPERALASVVELTTRVPGPTLKLRAKKFDGQEGQTLELNPRLVEGPDGELRRRVEIWLLNLEWDSVLYQTPSRPVAVSSRNREYLLLTSLLERTPPPLEGEIEIADFVRGGTPTSPLPCRNPAMRMLYFPQGGGQSIRNVPCSPMWGEWGD